MVVHRHRGKSRGLAEAAQQDARAYDYATYADTLLTDFAQLTAPPMPTSSNP